MDLHGIGHFNGWTGIAHNCCSMGELTVKRVIDYGASGLIMKTGSEFNNAYYLEGINSKITLAPETGAVSFVKTSGNTEDMTSQKVVDALNQYIEEHKEDEGENVVNTSDWLKWRVGENGLPELIFE